jgi:hypothetical protein
MALPPIVPWFDASNYAAVKAACGSESYFANSFDEWLQRETQRVADFEAKGIGSNKVIIDSKEFAAYCRTSGVEPNSEILRGFAVAVHHKRSNH